MSLSALAVVGLLWSGVASSDAQIEDRSPGFYPTLDEVDLLGGESHDMYPRRLGGINGEGPDAGSLTASGIWHQDEEPGDNFYERYDKFFSPLDSTLGFFAPRELALLEANEEPSQESLSGFADAGFPLTRDFNPDLAMLKAGPLHMDLLSLSGTVLYSDYSGDREFEEGQEDGWLSVIQLSFRGVLQLTDNLYLSATGQVYYLPESGDVGFFFGGGQNSFLRLAYETVYRDWDITIYDEFRVYHRLSEILDEVEHDEIDAAGRYRFGRFSDNRETDYFDSDSIYFLNRAGIAASKELGDWWLLSTRYDHNDYWRTMDFENHRTWDEFYARLDYDGQDWRFAPFAEYRLTAVDEFDSRFHAFYLGAAGPLTENVRLRGRIGYLHSEGLSADINRWVGDVGIYQELTSTTSHSLTGGVTQTILEEGDNWLASFGRYTIRQELGARARASAFAQYAELENLDVDDLNRNGWSFGGTLGADLGDYTNVQLSAAYDRWDTSTGVNQFERDRMIYRATLSQRLAPYLYARLLYQYEDYDSESGGDFDEHLYMLTITHVF